MKININDFHFKYEDIYYKSKDDWVYNNDNWDFINNDTQEDIKNRKKDREINNQRIEKFCKENGLIYYNDYIEVPVKEIKEYFDKNRKEINRVFTKNLWRKEYKNYNYIRHFIRLFAYDVYGKKFNNK